MRDLPCCAEIYGTRFYRYGPSILQPLPSSEVKRTGVARQWQSVRFNFLNFHFLSVRNLAWNNQRINEESIVRDRRWRDNCGLTQFAPREYTSARCGAVIKLNCGLYLKYEAIKEASVLTFNPVQDYGRWIYNRIPYEKV